MRPIRALLSLVAAALLLGCPQTPTPPAPGSAAGGGKLGPKGERRPKTGAAAQVSSKSAVDLGPAPPQTVSVSDVRVGQRYRFRTHQSQLTTHEVWRITRVDLDTGVHYELTSKTEVGDADPIESGPTPQVAQLSFEDVPPPPGPPPVASGRETVVVGGVPFECTIYTQDKTRRWISERFPRLIKVEQEGEVFKELVAIEEPE